MDLGISSMQVDQPERGFSYSRNAPLDMRMDPTQPRTAADVLAEASEEELAGWFKTYGEERYARPIARAIVRQRAKAPLVSTCELVELIRGAIPTPALFAGGHPAKRVFQALRIVVNDELGILERGLEEAFDAAGARRAPRGDLVPLARGPHRQAVHAGQARGCICPPDLPACVCGREPEGMLALPKAVARGAKSSTATRGLVRAAARDREGARPVSTRGALASRPAPAPGARPKPRTRPQGGAGIAPPPPRSAARARGDPAGRRAVRRRRVAQLRQAVHDQAAGADRAPDRRASATQIGQLKPQSPRRTASSPRGPSVQGMVRPASAELTFVEPRDPAA